MRRLRVTASMKKALEGARYTRTGRLRRGGVMQVPRILSCDEWEALAAVQQDALIAASYEDRGRQVDPHLAIGPDPSDVSHRYKN